MPVNIHRAVNLYVLRRGTYIMFRASMHKNNIVLSIIIAGVFAIGCGPRTIETEFSKNRKADQENPISMQEFAGIIGQDRYNDLVSGIGESELERLTYGVGQSNMVSLINEISDGDKLVALMSGTNKLTSIDIIDMLLQTDAGCSLPEASSSDTIKKVANLINAVNLTGMEGLKDIIHDLKDNPKDLNGRRPMARLGYMLALVDETQSVMPTIINDLTAPSGCIDPAILDERTCLGGGNLWYADFNVCKDLSYDTQASCPGTHSWVNPVYSGGGVTRVSRLINNSNDMKDIADIINNTTVLNNLNNILTGLSSDDTCSNGTDKVQYKCLANGGTWSTNTLDGIDSMLRLLNESGTCSDGVSKDNYECVVTNGQTWTSDSSNLATIVNGVTQIVNLNGILNSITNDGKKPGDAGNVMDGTDAMVETLKVTADINKLIYVINGLSTTTGDSSNDDDFEQAAANCGTNTRSELEKFLYGISPMPSGANQGQNSWYINSAAGATGSCAAQTDASLDHGEIAAWEYTTNLTTAGTVSFNYKVSSEAPSAIKEIKVLSGGTGYTSAPSVSISGGGGSGAIANAEVSVGAVGTLTLTNAGSGYTSNPTISFSGGGGTGAAAEAQRRAVALNGLTLTAGGSYQTVPTVSFSGGGGSGATAYATLPTTSVSGLTVLSNGSGYTSDPSCSITGGGGSGATCSADARFSVASIGVTSSTGTCHETGSISCTVSGSATCSVSTSDCSCGTYCDGKSINSINVTGGGDYATTSYPSVTLSYGTAAVTGMSYSSMQVSVTNGGSGYSSPPQVTLSGGGGGGAVVSAQIPSRAVSSITLTGGGSYTSAPAVEFIGGGGSGATATASVPASEIQSLTLTNGGSGYTSAPTVTLSGGGGTGATVTATVDPMSVTKINLTNAGSGYSSEPVVTLSGGGGSGATAKATISGDYFKFYIDDELVLVSYGNTGWQTYTSPSLGTGIHRFRFEYVKDDSTDAGDDKVYVDNLTLPGSRGVDRYSYEKVAILLNKLYITAITNVADVLNNTSYTPGLDNLVSIINRVEYPADIDSMPNLVAIVNELSDVSTLTDMLNNLNTATGVDNIVEVVDHIGQGDKVASMVKNLSGGTPGIKLTQILNTLTGQGTNALIKMLDGLDASYPLNTSDDFYEIIDLINGVSSTAYVPAILNELNVYGKQSITTGFDSYPTGGAKMAQVFKAVKTKSIATGENATCDSNPDSFCSKNHLVRLVEDLSSGAGGAADVGKIISYLDPDALTLTGPERVVEVMYALKNQGTKYDNALWNGTGDDFGRLTTLIADMGGNGPYNIATLINEVNSTYLGNRLAYLVQNSNRIKYLSRLVTEMTNVDLIITLLNESSTNIIKIQNLVNVQGNLAYGTGSYGVAPSSYYTNADSTTTADNLGRLIVLINEISGSGVNNIVQIVNQTYDMDFLASPTSTFSYGAKSDGNGFGLLNAADRIRYLSNLINGVENIQLLINVINGQSGTMTDGVDYSKMITLIDNVGGSTRKGKTTKSVGDVSIISGTINELGWDYGSGFPRSISDQMRVVTIINNVVYCGLRHAHDRTSTPGDNASEYFTCDSHVNYAYNKNVDSYDKRHRLSNFLLGMTNSRPVSIIVGDVSDTYKTVNILNGTRRINTIIKAVDWMPGEVTADLVNHTWSNRIMTGFVYLANNLDPDEDIAAQAFTQMIHWGVKLPTSGCGDGNRNCGCVSFTAVGPKRLGGVLNTETGQYLEGIMQMFGWRSAIPALVCGFSAWGNGWGQDVGPSTYSTGTSADGTSCSTSERCQQISGGAGTVRFKNYESIYITNNPTPGAKNGANYTHYYREPTQSVCENFYPENSGALGFDRDTDQIVTRGFSPLWGVSVEAGISGVWDVLKGSGIIGWLLQEGGTLGLPPVQANGVSPHCTNSGYGSEWDCIKHGKDSSPNISYYRWGNTCSIPGYTTASSCEGAGGRWMPNKNYSGCQMNLDTDAPVE